MKCVSHNHHSRFTCCGFWIILLCALVVPSAKAQIAGISSFSVIDMSLNSRSNALGMDYLSVADNDFSLAIDNPSLIGRWADNYASLNFITTFEKANYGSLSYGMNTNGLGTFVFGLRFYNYGRFQGFDEAEISTGDFFASDYVLSVGWGRAIDSNFSFGVNFKPVYSNYDGYTALAVAFDVAGGFCSDDKLFSATLMARNIGKHIVIFDETFEKVPWELTAGLSYKLKNAPFRLFLNLTELQKWNLRYEDALNPTSSTDPFTGVVTTQSKGTVFLDNLARHVQVGVELSVKKVFYARLGYNYRQMKEVQSFGNFNAGGFSFGFGLHVKGFDFCYSRNNYHYGQAPNFISITTDLNRFFKKIK